MLNVIGVYQLFDGLLRLELHQEAGTDSLLSWPHASDPVDSVRAELALIVDNEQE